MKIKLFMVILLMVGLSACEKEPKTDINMVLNTVKNYGVTLEAKPDEGIVYIPSNPQGWESENKKNGYVGFGAGQSGWTVFVVDDEDTADSCSKTAKWVITQLRLSAKGDVDTEKGNAFGEKPPGWVKRVFRNVDDHGVLFPTNSRAQGVTFLSVYNANRNKRSRGKKFIYYEVTLTRCSDGLTLTTDPGWGNEGRD
jgi:hypothetical protein